MASVEAMTRSQQKLLEAGRAKLAKHKERNNKSKNRNKNSSPKKRSAILDAKINSDGSPRVGRSPRASSNSRLDMIDSIELGREEVHSIGAEVDQPKRIEIEPGDGRRNEGLVEDQTGQFSLSDVPKSFKNEAEDDRKQGEPDETLREQQEAEEQGKQFALVESMKRRRKEHETAEVRRQCENEEAGRKEREDFSGLEQHIQDLTVENFALQRELAKARETTQEVFAEHSAVVENFNNQGLVVNQLKDDIKKLEERILEREAFAMVLMSERDRSRQDFEAAREQSLTMASEVVVLENRIRTLRSNELKMEKDMINLSCEMDSLRKQAVNLEQDRVYLQSLIDALQEEKKVLQVRLRQIALGEREVTNRNENSEAVQLRQRHFADASTSTDDLPSPLKISTEGPSNPLDNPFLDSWHQSRKVEEPTSSQSIAYSSYFRPTNESLQSPFMQSPLSSNRYSHHFFSDLGPSSLSESTNNPQSGGYPSIQLPASCTSIPADLMKIISNINDVIISISEERNTIVNALKTESKGAADLRALNADLSRQLESTTEQLERLAAQRMLDRSSSNEPTTARNAAALHYVDEGDEVVDRMLIWIMQLFPSRTSSRRNGVKRL